MSITCIVRCFLASAVDGGGRGNQNVSSGALPGRSLEERKKAGGKQRERGGREEGTVLGLLVVLVEPPPRRGQPFCVGQALLLLLLRSGEGERRGALATVYTDRRGHQAP